MMKRLVVFRGSLGKMPLKQNVKLLPYVKLVYYMKEPYLFQFSITMVEIASISWPSVL